MKIIAVTNQKGGVAKTTTATTMAAGLKKRGYRVLLIDTDPQWNSTDTYRAQIDDQATLFDVLCAGEKISEAIQHTEAGDIVASDPLLVEAEQRMTEQGREFRLKEAIEEIEGLYDYIIIDTPPGLGILLTNALTAATACIIPISADRYGLQGLSGLDKSIGRVRKYSNRDLKIAGLLFCKYNPNLNLSKAVMEVVQGVEKDLGTQMYQVTIRETVAAREAQAARKTLFDAAPNCTAAKDYDAFLDEFLYQSEGMVYSAFGAVREARVHRDNGGEFRFFDGEDKWGFSFSRNDVMFSFYSGPEGGLFVECEGRDRNGKFQLAGASAFPGEPQETEEENQETMIWDNTSKSVYAYIFK